MEIGASSAFYYGKVPYYHLNGHFLIIEWWALKRDCLRCEDWWICQRWIVGDFEWRLFFGVRRVCSGRISGPIAGPGPLDFFFFLLLFYFASPAWTFSIHKSWGRELFLRRKSLSAGGWEYFVPRCSKASKSCLAFQGLDRFLIHCSSSNKNQLPHNINIKVWKLIWSWSHRADGSDYFTQSLKHTDQDSGVWRFLNVSSAMLVWADWIWSFALQWNFL